MADITSGAILAAIRNEMLDHVFTATAYSTASGGYIALFDSVPAAAGGAGAEAAYAGYTNRPAIAWSSASGGTITSSDATISFDAATGSGGPYTHYAIMTAATAGTMIAYGELTSGLSVVSGNTPKVTGTDITIGMATSATGDSAAQISVYLANKLLDLALSGTAYSSPNATIEVVLTSTNSTASTPGTTVTGTDYADEAATSWAAASAGATSNSATIDFGTVGAGGWATIVSLYIGDGTNMLFFGNDVVNQTTPAAGDTVSLASGALDVALN